MALRVPVDLIALSLTYPFPPTSAERNCLSSFQKEACNVLPGDTEPNKLNPGQQVPGTTRDHKRYRNGRVDERTIFPHRRHGPFPVGLSGCWEDSLPQATDWRILSGEFTIPREKESIYRF